MKKIQITMLPNLAPLMLTLRRYRRGFEYTGYIGDGFFFNAQCLEGCAFVSKKKRQERALFQSIFVLQEPGQELKPLS